MDIKLATIEDAERLALLGSETFWDAYRSTSKLESTRIREYMSKAFTVTQLKKELNDPAIEFLIANLKSKNAGYAKLILGSKHESVKAKSPIEISRIYLAKSYWSKGLGKELLEACFENAREKECDSIWLGVWQHNERAIEFYKRNGFEIVGETQFNLASSLETDHVMARSL